MIGSLEDSGDISIKFDFVNTLVHVLRLYPEKCKSFELYPFFLFHLGGTGPALSYSAATEQAAVGGGNYFDQHGDKDEVDRWELPDRKMEAMVEKC